MAASPVRNCVPSWTCISGKYWFGEFEVLPNVDTFHYSVGNIAFVNLTLSPQKSQ